MTNMLGAKELRKNPTPSKVKLFFWLALHSRIWTNDRWRHHGLQAIDTCALYDQAAEIVDHLLLQCPFSRETWHYCLQPLGLRNLQPTTDDELAFWWLSSHLQLPVTTKKAFDALVLLIT